MDRILKILKKENGPRASSAPALELNTIIFKHVYWYMQLISGERLQDHWSSGVSDRLESSTDITSKASEADTESSDNEPENNQSEMDQSTAQAVSFKTGDKGSRAGSGSSLSTNIVSETSQIDSQGGVNKNKHDTDDVEDNLNRRCGIEKDNGAIEKHDKLEHNDNNQTTFESNEGVEKTEFTEAKTMQDTGVKNSVEVENENSRVNSNEETSDDVFEENYESCDEGEEPDQDVSENATSDHEVAEDIDTVENAKYSSDINDVAVIESMHNAEKVEQTQNKRENTTKDETNDKSFDPNSENTAKRTQNETKVKIGGEYESSKQDMRNIERPSLSGSED